MGTPVSRGKPWPLCPEGMNRAICVDVIERGVVQGQFGPQERVRLVFHTKKINPENDKPFQVIKDYNRTLYKSNLLADLQTWRGKDLTEEELDSFDLDVVIGKECQLMIVHRKAAGGRSYANIKVILPPVDDYEQDPVPFPENYVRDRDKDDDDESRMTAGKGVDNDVPF